MAGYVPSPEQTARCRKCRYWLRFNAAGMRCCQYILETGHSRGQDPCTKYERRPHDKKRNVAAFPSEPGD